MGGEAALTPRYKNATKKHKPRKKSRNQFQTRIKGCCAGVMATKGRQMRGSGESYVPDDVRKNSVRKLNLINTRSGS